MESGFIAVMYRLHESWNFCCGDSLLCFLVSRVLKKKKKSIYVWNSTRKRWESSQTFYSFLQIETPFMLCYLKRECPVLHIGNSVLDKVWACLLMWGLRDLSRIDRGAFQLSLDIGGISVYPWVSHLGSFHCQWEKIRTLRPHFIQYT